MFLLVVTFSVSSKLECTCSVTVASPVHCRLRVVLKRARVQVEVAVSGAGCRHWTVAIRRARSVRQLANSHLAGVGPRPEQKIIGGEAQDPAVKSTKRGTESEDHHLVFCTYLAACLHQDGSQRWRTALSTNL